MHAESPVADGLAALERHLSQSSCQAALTFGSLSGPVATALRDRGVGAEICELDNAMTGAAPAGFGLAVGVEPFRDLEPSGQRELLQAVWELLAPGGVCVIYCSTVFGSLEPAALEDQCCAATHVLLASRVGFTPEAMERRLTADPRIPMPPAMLELFDETERRTAAYALVLRRPEGPLDISELTETDER